MINWINLETTEQLDEVVKKSFEKPCVIFKHSTRCSISLMSKRFFEGDWHFENKENEPDAYYLDVLTSRPVSNKVADVFEETHASPQLLLINKGQCAYMTSHDEINFEDLASELQNV